MSHRFRKPILYLITRGASTDRTTSRSPEFHDILRLISAAVGAGVNLIQLREKNLTTRILFELTERAAELTRRSSTQLLVNDRADVALAAGADGVHLAGNSFDAATVRRTFGEQFIVGASTHSLEEARSAREQGADFIVFGPIFETESKRSFGPPLALEKLSEVIQELSEFPVLALGGISLKNAPDCIAAGAHGVAGISLFENVEILSGVCKTIREIAEGHLINQ